MRHSFATQTWPTGQQTLALTQVRVLGQHEPLMHVEPAEQTLAHAPQFCSSVCRSTQAVSQRFGVGAVQVIPHMPATQLALPIPAVGPGQTLPQVPQLFTSASTLRQTPLQQVWPAKQALPHAPQFASSVCRSTQAVPQSVGVGPLQVMPHMPATQVAVPVPTVGPGQTLLHAPQFCASACTVRHTPLQHSWPGPHIAPHAPQFWTSVCRFLQNPLQQV